MAYKLLALCFLSGSAESCLKAMDQESVLCNTRTKEELMSGLKDLPQELKLYIISLVLQLNLGYRVSLVHTLEVAYDFIKAVAFSPDGETVLTAVDDIKAYLWSFKTGREILKLQGITACISSVAFSPDGERILMGLIDKTAGLWCSKTGQLLLTLVRPDSVGNSWINAVAFHLDGETVLIGYEDDRACLWNSKTGELVRTLQGHSGSVNAVAFSLDGETICTGSHDTTARLWNSKTGACIRTFKGYVKTAFFDWTTGGYIRTSHGHTSPIKAVAFSPEGKTILTGSSDAKACLWSYTTGELVSTFIGHTGSVFSVAFSPTERIVVTGSYDTTAKVWDSKTGELLTSFTQHTGCVFSVAISPNGKAFVTGSADHTACVWLLVKGFEGLTAEEKESAFKMFITCCAAFEVSLEPLALEASNSTEEPTREIEQVDEVTEPPLKKRKINHHEGPGS